MFAQTATTTQRVPMFRSVFTQIIKPLVDAHVYRIVVNSYQG